MGLSISDILSLCSANPMKGTVRTLEVCPVCGRKFLHFPGAGFICPDHKTHPRFHFIDLYWKGKRYRAYSDADGQHLSDYQRSRGLLSKIQYEMQHGYFDPSHYCRKEQRQFWTCGLLDRFLKEKLKVIAPSYRAHYKIMVERAQAFFGTKDVREIRRLDLTNYRDSLKVTGKTLKNHLDLAKTFLHWCRRELEIIQVVPIPPAVDVAAHAPRWLGQEDQSRIFSLVREGDKPIIAFLMLHGCRPGEARALKLGDVSWPGQTISIQATFSGREYREKRKGRGAKPYIIPIHQEMRDFIAGRLKEALPGAFLFVNPRNGQNYTQNALGRLWRGVRKKAGIDDRLRLYDATRHSFASQLRAAGVSLANIKDHLGHSDIRTTLKYSHGDLESRRTDLEKLSLQKVEPIKKTKEGE